MKIQNIHCFIRTLCFGNDLVIFYPTFYQFICHGIALSTFQDRYKNHNLIDLELVVRGEKKEILEAKQQKEYTKVTNNIIGYQGYIILIVSIIKTTTQCCLVLLKKNKIDLVRQRKKVISIQWFWTIQRTESIIAECNYKVLIKHTKTN